MYTSSNHFYSNTFARDTVTDRFTCTITVWLVVEEEFTLQGHVGVHGKRTEHEIANDFNRRDTDALRGRQAGCQRLVITRHRRLFVFTLEFFCTTYTIFFNNSNFAGDGSDVRSEGVVPRRS